MLEKTCCMEFSIDVVFTVVVNLVILTAGGFYVYWQHSRRSLATVPGDNAAAANAGHQAGDKATVEPSTPTAASTGQGGQQLYTGTVRRFSQRNGMGFITCEATRQVYNIDVRIFREELDAVKAQVGDEVSFRVVVGGHPGCPRNHPWAAGVTVLRRGVATEQELAATDPNRGQEELFHEAEEQLPSRAQGFRRPQEARRSNGLRGRGAAASPSAAAAEPLQRRPRQDQQVERPAAAEPEDPIARGGLRASAVEFVPGQLDTFGDGSRFTLNAHAAEFVPQAPLAQGGLRVNAEEFVPGNLDTADDASRSTLNVHAAEFVPQADW